MGRPDKNLCRPARVAIVARRSCQKINAAPSVWQRAMTARGLTRPP